MTDTPHTSSPTARRGRTLAALVLVAGTFSLAACADSSTSSAPFAPDVDAPSLAKVKDATVTSSKVGDTTISKVTMLPNASPKSIDLGNGNKIDFPNGASSVCDIATSSYGPGTWNAPCTRSEVPVTFYAATWTDASGLSRSEFQPDMRFVPTDVVRLEMKNKNGKIQAGMRIDFCTAFGCIDEALTDPSLATTLDRRGGTAFRRIKHFSGYMVSVGLTDEPSDSTGTGYPVFP